MIASHSTTAGQIGVTGAERREPTHPPLMLYGVLCAVLAFGLYACEMVWVFLAIPFGLAKIQRFLIPLLYYNGALIAAGIILISIELAYLLPKKRWHRRVAVDLVHNPELTVVLTAYNDEQSIGPAVEDFRSHALVRRVLVIDNGSADRTAEVAARAGAIVFREDRPGYGNCVYRAFEEAVKHSDTELVLLCEGDRTFRAFDIEKFLAYVPHADIVNGTRIVEQLRDRDTQLSTFMYYGNFAAGKLLELKHIGRGTFTDVGTTYKLCRTRALAELLPHLNRRVNLEFNAHFLDTALRLGVNIVECPITFFARVGKSKGGNVNNVRALKVGIRMIAGMLLNWRIVAEN